MRGTLVTLDNWTTWCVNSSYVSFFRLGGVIKHACFVLVAMVCGRMGVFESLHVEESLDAHFLAFTLHCAYGRVPTRAPSVWGQ